MSSAAYLACLSRVCSNVNGLRFYQAAFTLSQRAVRPCSGLLVFAAGFRQRWAVSIMAPYATYITYETTFLLGCVA